MVASSESDIDTIFFGLSLSAFVLVFIPFYWHLKAKNTGTCLFMAWIGLACLVLSINSFLWNNNTSNSAPVWCDISSKFIIGANAAIPSVSLCINLRLWLIASDRVRTLEKRRVLFVELLLGLGVPMLEMLFQYFVQDRRFDIYEGFGCRAASENVLMMYLLLLAPQFLLGIASMIFFVLAFIAYHRMYKFMLDTQHSPTFHRRTTLSASFLWFLTLGGVTILCSIAYAAFVMYFNATANAAPGSYTNTFKLWQSWDLTHLKIKDVNVYNEKDWRGDMMTEFLLEVDRWIFVGLALLFFVFFGITSEARRRYKMLLRYGGGRGKWIFDVNKTMVNSSDRGIVHYTVGDTGSAGGSTSTFVSTNNLGASISQPELVTGQLAVNVLPKDPFRLDNPYPKHIHDQKPAYSIADRIVTSESATITEQTGDNSDLAASKSEGLAMPSPSAHPSYTGSSTSLPVAPVVSSTSISSERHAQEPTNFSSPSTISSPLPAYVSDCDTTRHVQGKLASETRTRHVSLPSTSTSRGRSYSTGSYGNHTRRVSARARSLSRSISISAPPNRPLPDPPPEVPSTPSVVRELQAYQPNNFSQKSSASWVVHSPTRSSAAADILAHHGRTTPRPSVPDIHALAGKPF